MAASPAIRARMERRRRLSEMSRAGSEYGYDPLESPSLQSGSRTPVARALYGGKAATPTLLHHRSTPHMANASTPLSASTRRAPGFEGKGELGLGLMPGDGEAHSDRSGGGGEAGPGRGDGKMSSMQTLFNIVNLFVGLGLLSTPYAISQCGWLGLAGLAVVTLMCNHTGKIIIKAFDAASGGDPGACSFHGVGEAAFGRAGRWVVNVFVYLEFLGALAMCLVFLWSQIAELRPAWNHVAITLGSAALILPSLWVQRFSELSFISLLGFAASALTTVVVIVVFSQDAASDTGDVPRRIHDGELGLFRGVEGYGVGIGIFTTSLAGQACLPVLYSQMRHPEEYPRVLDAAFVDMLMATFGWLRYGDNVAVVVTASLARAPGGLPSTVSMLLVIASCACTIAPITAVLGEMLLDQLGLRPTPAAVAANKGDAEAHAGIARALEDDAHGIVDAGSDASGARHAGGSRRGGPLSSGLCELMGEVLVGRVVRSAILCVAVTIGWFSFYYLGNLESLVGGLGSLFTSLVLPAVFYAKLSWERLGAWERVLEVAIAGGGLALSAFVVADNWSNVAG